MKREKSMKSALLALPIGLALAAIGTATAAPSTAAIGGRAGVGTPCLVTGDIFVSDATAFGVNNGGVIWVDSPTGTRGTLSENNNPVGGPDLETPNAIAFETGGSIVVTDSWSVAGVRIPSVVRIDANTGTRTLVSNNASPAGGPAFVEPHGIAVEADGSILVSDISAFPQFNGGVIRVNPVTGARTTLSRNSAPVGGPRFDNAWDLVVAPNGDIYVIDDNPNAGGEVIRIDPVTGARTLISDNTNPAGGPAFVWPWGIALEADGDILISDKEAFGGSGGIIRVDPATGVRTTVSKNTAPAGGPLFQSPGDLFVEFCGDILVTDQFANAVFRVDSATGVRTTVSDNASPGSPNFSWAWGIAARAATVSLPRGGGGSSSGGGHDVDIDLDVTPRREMWP